jgi:hypothetical protein
MFRPNRLVWRWGFRRAFVTCRVWISVGFLAWNVSQLCHVSPDDNSSDTLSKIRPLHLSSLTHSPFTTNHTSPHLHLHWVYKPSLNAHRILFARGQNGRRLKLIHSPSFRAWIQTKSITSASLAWLHIMHRDNCTFAGVFYELKGGRLRWRPRPCVRLWPSIADYTVLWAIMEVLVGVIKKICLVFESFVKISSETSIFYLNA